MNKQKEFIQLLETCRNEFSRYCKALSQSDEDAKDLFGDSILLCYEKFDSIMNKESFKYYLFSIARNKKRNLLRRLKLVIVNNEVPEQISNTRSDSNYDIQVLYNAIESLPFEQKEAIVLYELSGFKVDEIAEIQKASISSVKSRLSRSREKLQKIILDDISKILEKETS